MIYCFNHGIGWASSGVEYAQAYRARVLRKLGIPAKFIFTDMFPKDNIQHMTKNIGFEDEEIIWLYSFFTDFRIAPVSFTLADLEATFERKDYRVERNGKTVKYLFSNPKDFYTCYMVNETDDRVHRVEYVSNGCLIRKDYFTYKRLYSEYYAPLNNSAHLYQRRFFNEDGTVAYEEINDNDNVVYRFPDAVLYRKEDLVGYLVRKLELTEKDIVIIDRSTDIGQAILENVGRAKVGSVIHADHFSEGSTDENYILWNNYYEYAFAQHQRIDFYVTATEEQNKLVRQQFLQYVGVEPNVVTIPVGSAKELKYPGSEGRMPYSMLTASRLATEKHIDWLIEAVCQVKKEIPEVTLDVYGQGVEADKLKELIAKNNAGEYIRMMGQHNLTEVYQKYEAYVAASTSEGFGLTLLEATAAGLPIVGFNVRYGNPTFIDDSQNGYLIDLRDDMEKKDKVNALAECIKRLFTEADLEAFHQHAYSKAERFLEKEVESLWQNLIRQMV